VPRRLNRRHPIGTVTIPSSCERQSAKTAPSCAIRAGHYRSGSRNRAKKCADAVSAGTEAGS